MLSSRYALRSLLVSGIRGLLARLQARAAAAAAGSRAATARFTADRRRGLLERRALWSSEASARLRAGTDTRATLPRPGWLCAARRRRCLRQHPGADRRRGFAGSGASRSRSPGGVRPGAFRPTSARANPPESRCTALATLASHNQRHLTVIDGLRSKKDRAPQTRLSNSAVASPAPQI